VSDAPGATAAPAKRGRYPQTALALVGAIIGCLGIVAFLVLVVVRPDSGTRPSTDWHTSAAEAASAYGPGILDPQLPEGWTANYARIGTAGDATTWEIGFLSPAGGYVGLVQILAESQNAVLPDVLDDPSGEARIGGLEWTVFDRRTIEPTGNYARNLVADLPDSVVLLHGNAADTDFDTVAAAVAAEAAQ